MFITAKSTKVKSPEKIILSIKSMLRILNIKVLYKVIFVFYKICHNQNGTIILSID